MAKDNSRGWGGTERATTRWYDVGFTGWRKSRQNRTCDFCGSNLPKGEKYYRVNESAFCNERCAIRPAATMSG
jgi:hypothetical protein